MSVLVTMKMSGDVATFRAALADRGDDFVAISERGKAAGAVHHRFGIGDGFVVVVDEWEAADQFEKFFSDPELQKFIGEVGADVSSPPEITITEAVSSPDEF